jgi:uncharacterized protein YceH (UPF0502 family)
VPLFFCLARRNVAAYSPRNSVALCVSGLSFSFFSHDRAPLINGRLPQPVVYHIRVNFNLSPAETRLLGCLIEKEVTTPDYYPLSLNALQNAANQKSNREPVMDLDEESIRRALHSLADQGLARSAATDSRVAKFEHRLADVFNFHRHEIALICVLLLRGPQTPGELRTRTERLYAFEDLNAVHSALNLLMNRQPPLVKLLARQPGTKEARYAHLLSGDVSDQSAASSSVNGIISTASSESSSAAHEAAVAATYSERLMELEREVADLRSEVSDLKQQLASFQKQFQ